MNKIVLLMLFAAIAWAGEEFECHKCEDDICGPSTEPPPCQRCPNGCIPHGVPCQPLCSWYDKEKYCPERFCHWNGTACNNACPNLEDVDPHILKVPPVLTKVELCDNKIELAFKLPQMSPARWDVSANLAHPYTLAQSIIDIPVERKKCEFLGYKILKLSELIAKGKPYIVTTATQYIYEFAINVSWWEQFVLDKNCFPRHSEALLRFNIVVNRQIVLRSTICTLDSTLLWAYLVKGAVYVPVVGNPYIDFELLTVAAECNYHIDVSSFRVKKFNGTVVAVTKPVLAEASSCGLQKWNIRVTFEDGICFATGADSFTLKYTLVGIPQGCKKDCTTVATHEGEFTATLAGLENWCAVNVETSLCGQQTTYDCLGGREETCCFFLGDYIYVRDFVGSSGPAVQHLSIQGVWLSGPALIGGPVQIFPFSTNDWDYALTSCPDAFDPAKVCYKFLLRADKVKIDKELDIKTKLLASFPTKKRALAEDQDSEVATSILIRNAGAKKADANAAHAASAVPAVLALALAVLLV